MADDPEDKEGRRQHLEWLLDGVEAWNARRARANFKPVFTNADIRDAFYHSRTIRMDHRVPLKGANLREADLLGANLRGADLAEADLSRANLLQADLNSADLGSTNLQGAELGGADLREAILGGANLRGATLREAFLRGATLVGTNLEGADLKKAILGGANLREANLAKAILERAELRNATLIDANLFRADLSVATLRSANLAGAVLVESNLAGADLEEANLVGADLEEANIKSVLNTIDASKFYFTDLSTALSLTQAQLDSMRGDSGTIIPDHLTRPDHWPLLKEPSPHHPIQTLMGPFIFLSYASRNRDRIRALHAFLSGQSVPVWWDRDIPAGASWRGEIAARLAAATAVLTLWTEDSTQSKGVIEEAASAQADGKLVHARLDDAPLPYGFAETQYVDLRTWDGSPDYPEMRKLLQALRDKLEPPTAHQMAERLHQATPVDMVARDGKLSPVDTPPHTAPEIVNADDLDARLAGLRQTLAGVQARTAYRDAYQLPTDLYHCLDRVEGALNADGLTWYALEDSQLALSGCMDDHDAADSWNDGIVRDLQQIVTRIRQLRPLLQPRQIPPGDPDAKPPEPDPVIRAAQIPEAVEAVEQLGEELDTDAAKATLHPSVEDLLRKAMESFIEASAQPNEDRKQPRLRTALRRLAYLTGAIIVATSPGVVVNLLTAPDAAAVLSQRLMPIFDLILRFFL